MDIISIKYFIAVAENQSFTGAARDLFVSQPSISRKIAELESELALELFYRTGKTIKLTAAGWQLLPAFKNLLQLFDEILVLANDISNTVTGTITLGVPQHMDLSRSIPGFFNMFYHSNPGTKILMKYCTRRDLINNFLAGQTDGTFFLLTDAEHIENEVSVKKLDLPKGMFRLLYSPALFPDRFQPTLESFFNIPYLFYKSSDDSYNISLIPDEILNEVSLIPKNRICVDSLDALLLYVSEGIGFSVVGPSWRVDKSEKIHEIPITNGKSMVSLCLCWKESNKNPAFGIFTNALNKWCERKRDEST